MYLMPLTVHLQMAKMVHFMWYVFYHNFLKSIPWLPWRAAVVSMQQGFPWDCARDVPTPQVRGAPHLLHVSAPVAPPESSSLWPQPPFLYSMSFSHHSLTYNTLSHLIYCSSSNLRVRPSKAGYLNLFCFLLYPSSQNSTRHTVGVH